ncbi:DUF2795 domain-containing protein [Streptomyces candidus]|uniref:DUF2795 domain-containing protein n=1 Tax=Streptomyces candidus TaxID=67283 RepID=A0A7X0HBP3_9ACTN|nr:DUF2795 domain-containing protein [Streptomyces candidus]MBB6434673.1 hypothetical protein [Streptomyces candidus]GHH35829.1 hypothetical protein GCM10018773_09800 [Streptomyces candidus]
MQRGSDRVSRRQDDEMKHELEGLLRSGHPTRTEEWHDPEPVADDDPELASDPMPRPGPEGEFEKVRFELARHLGRTQFPADRDGVVSMLRHGHAPDRLCDVVAALPGDAVFDNVQAVAVAAVPEAGRSR